MAILHVIGYHVDYGDIARIGISTALLGLRVEVCVCSTNYVLSIRLDELHAWLDDGERGQIGTIIYVWVAIHELEVSCEVLLRSNHLVETITVELAI